MPPVKDRSVTGLDKEGLALALGGEMKASAKKDCDGLQERLPSDEPSL